MSLVSFWIFVLVDMSTYLSPILTIMPPRIEGSDCEETTIEMMTDDSQNSCLSNGSMKHPPTVCVMHQHCTFVSSLIVSPFWRKPLRATFSSARLVASKGWKGKNIHSLPLVITECFNWLRTLKRNTSTYYVRMFYTWAVVTEQMTSPRCALIILPKAVITSPVRVRRPLSANTSAKKKNKGICSNGIHSSSALQCDSLKFKNAYTTLMLCNSIMQYTALILYYTKL